MIDLRESGLPDAIECDGEVFAVKTDFRVWLKFVTMLDSEGRAWYGIFDGVVPSGRSWISSAIEFAESKNVTPRSAGTSRDRVCDYVLDGDYIVASFQQAYGIDLTDPECRMHWHRFLALFRGLPDETCMSRIMGYRSWQKSSKKHDDVMREMRERYRLPERGEEERRSAVLELAEKIFG